MKFRLIEHDAVDSTSERAFAELASGTARHGDVHVAVEQTAGRGRRGASWRSARGEGLYMSVVLMPAPPPLGAAALTMAGGLAVFDAARALGLEQVALKWPNDVVVAGAKLAGVLVETRGLDPVRPHYVVGIGVNVRQRSFPPDLAAERAVTSFALAGRDAPAASDASIEQVRDAVLHALAARLEHAREPALDLTRDFVNAAQLRDREVRVVLPTETITGRVRDLTLERGLVIERPDRSAVELALEHVRQVTAQDRVPLD